MTCAARRGSRSGSATTTSSSAASTRSPTAGRSGRRGCSQELAPVPEHGWLAVFEAHAALGEDDTALARRLAGEARELGRRLGAVDLEMFAVATEGAALVADGEVAAGMRRLDEAAAAALGGEYEDLRAAGWTCCYLIGACERVRDFERAAQWCREVEAFSRRLDIRFVTGVCRTHYGAVL